MSADMIIFTVFKQRKVIATILIIQTQLMFAWTAGSCVTSQILDYSNSLTLTTEHLTKQTQVILPCYIAFCAHVTSRTFRLAELYTTNTYII
jgi:hypothetical protein